MASSVSTLNNYSNFPLFSYGDLSLLTAGMSAMQGKIDTNRQKLDQMADVLSSEIYNSMSREGDKEHFRQRLNQGLGVINKYASGDLSDDQLMKQLSNKMNEIVDTRVMNAVSSTATRRVEEQKWDWYKENEPEKYSEKNRILRSKQWNSYANSQDPNAKYVGGGDFAEYVDPYKVLMSEDFAKSLKDLGINGKWVQQANGGLYFDYIDEKEGTRPENAQKLAQAVQGALGQKGMTQLALNAEWEYGDVYNPDNVNRLREDYNNYYSSKAKTRGEDKEIMEKMLASATPEEKQMLQQRIKSLESEVSQYASKNFDADVVGDNGVIDINKYNNIYTSLGVNSQLESLIGFAYQEPVTIARKIEDIKFEIIKHNEAVRQFDETMSLNKDKFALEIAKHEFNKTKEANKNSPDSPANPTDFTQKTKEGSGTLKDELGKHGMFQLTAQDQRDAVSALQESLGIQGLSSSDRLALSEQLVTTPVGDIKSITIGGQTVPINEENRANVLTALNKYKEVFVNGDSTTRQYRNMYEGVQKDNRDNILAHYRNYRNDHTGLAVNNDDFYFEKDSSGQVVYKSGRLKEGKTNYQYLMDKATKEQGGYYKNLTKEEQATLDLYFTKDIVQSNSYGMSDWEKRQYYETQKEKLYKQFGAKVVNTMKGFDNDSKPTPFISGGNTSFLNELDGGIWNLGKPILYVANAFKSSTQQYKEGIRDNQDSNISKMRSGDGGLGTLIGDRLTNVTTNMNKTVEGRFKGASRYEHTTSANSESGKLIQSRTGIAIPDKAIITVTPVIKNNLQTGQHNVSYTLPAGTGKNADAKTFSNVAMINNTDIGNIFKTTDATIYNTSLGNRAGVLELGKSIVRVDNNPSNINNDRPSQSYTTRIQNIAKEYKDNPAILYYLQQEHNKYVNGGYSFSVKPLGVGANYAMFIKDESTGVDTPVLDLQMKTLSEARDIPLIYKELKESKEDTFIEEVLLKNIKGTK